MREGSPSNKSYNFLFPIYFFSSSKDYLSKHF
nr:MAG TPA: hypothetical protein [Caudoviricetes sp.]